MNPAIQQAIRDSLGNDFEIVRSEPQRGGHINQAFRLEGADGSRYFLKLNSADQHTMFETEYAGLETMAATRTLRVPQPIAHGVSEGLSFLVLEWLDLHNRGNERLLGERLAELHGSTAPAFGFAVNNFIGTTPQPNGWMKDWVEFWGERRLAHQFHLAERNGHHLGVVAERLLERLPEFFRGYTPRPALLHGDLWSGNHAYLADGSPVIFDPAPYYGDREADIAMTELFGGYGADFYAAYRAHAPLDAGYRLRRDLYNLYHILNHANLFGKGYAHQAQGMMRHLLAELG